MNLERIRELNQQHYSETRPGKGFYRLEFGDTWNCIEVVIMKARAAGFVVDNILFKGKERAWDVIDPRIYPGADGVDVTRPFSANRLHDVGEVDEQATEEDVHTFFEEGKEWPWICREFIAVFTEVLGDRRILDALSVELSGLRDLAEQVDAFLAQPNRIPIAYARQLSRLIEDVRSALQPKDLRESMGTMHGIVQTTRQGIFETLFPEVASVHGGNLAKA